MSILGGQTQRRTNEPAATRGLLTKFALFLLLGALIEARAAGPGPEEYQVKGAYLLNFAKFVDWPPQTFKTPSDPIVICILGQDPFGPGFEKAAQSTVAQNRPVSVKQIAEGSQACQCQIAFVTESERKLSKALLQAVRDANVLTVGESDGFTTNGGVVEFKLDGDRVRIEINTAAAERAKLHISAKLLSLAQAGKH